MGAREPFCSSFSPFTLQELDHHSGAESVGTDTQPTLPPETCPSPVESGERPSPWSLVSTFQKHPHLVPCLLPGPGLPREATGANLSAGPQTGSRRGCCSSWRRCRRRGRTPTADPGRAPDPWPRHRTGPLQPQPAGPDPELRCRLSPRSCTQQPSPTQARSSRSGTLVSLGIVMRPGILTAARILRRQGEAGEWSGGVP